MLRNILRYLVLWVLVGMLSILYNTYYMSIIFLTLTVIPLVLFVLLCYLYYKITAGMLSIVHVAKKGEEIPTSVRIHNPTIFPVSNLKLNLSYRNAYSPVIYKKSYTVSVDANTKATVTCKLLSEYSGNLEISLKSIRIYDYLKLFSLKKSCKGELKVAVLPTYQELSVNQLLSYGSSSVENDSYAMGKSGDDPSEVFSIREYREGDRQQRIHWKLSRKLNQLMIKEFSDPINCSILLFLDLSIPKELHPMLFMDSILECALTVSYTLIQGGQLHYFAWYDEKRGCCQRVRIMQEKDFYEAVDGLLKVSPYSAATKPLSAYVAEYVREQYDNLFFITGQQPEHHMEALSLVKAVSKHLIHIGDIDNTPETRCFPKEIMKHSNDMRLILSSVDVNHIQRDMEQLRLE